MKRFINVHQRIMLSSVFLSLAVALMGCGGGGDDPEPPAISLSVSPETIDVPASGGSYTVTVSTTGKEWGVYTESDFVKVTPQYATNSVTVVVDENPTTSERTASIGVMSGSARKYIALTQAGAAKPAYDAPEGYTLVWQDEFNSGSELNGDDWTHEVKNAGWVNNELQNYVNHKTPGGSLVTEVKNGTLRIHCLKEDGKIYSGRVYAKVKSGWKYGYIEASIKSKN